MNKVILSGTSNRSLALKIGRHTEIKMGKVEISQFPNGEIRIRVEEKVEGKIVYIIQSLNYPAERYIIELALIADAVKRKGARKIVAVIPWLGYSPQDKVFREGEPLSSYVIAKILDSSAINHFVIVDVHSKLVLKMFKKKVTHLSAMEVFVDYFKGKLSGNWCSVALDKGAVERVSAFAKSMKIPLVKFEKSRDRESGEVTFHRLKGDVKGQNIITFDDFVSTGGTTIKSAEFLKDARAKKCYYCVTHLIVPETVKKIKESLIDKMFISDSIFIDKKYLCSKVKLLSISKLIARFICNY